MEIKHLGLKILDGTKPSDEFIDDLETFSSLSVDLKKEVIRNTFCWYSNGDIDKQWNEWKKGKTEEEEKRLIGAMRLILFIMKTGLIKRFTNDDFADQLNTIAFDSDITTFFLNELDKNKENLVKEIEEIEKRLLARLDNLEWRIDIKKSSTYSKQIDELSIMLKMSLVGGETDKVTLEFTSEELNSLIDTLSLIRRDVEKLEMEG